MSLLGFVEVCFALILLIFWKSRRLLRITIFAMLLARIIRERGT
jgi:hypothetical protein